MHKVRLAVPQRIVLQKCEKLTHMKDNGTQVFGHLLNFFHTWCACTTNTREKKTLCRTEFGEGKRGSHVVVTFGLVLVSSETIEDVVAPVHLLPQDVQFLQHGLVCDASPIRLFQDDANPEQ
jgi:hypothetical protein